MSSLSKIIKYGLLALQREGKGPGNSRNDGLSTALRGYYRTLTDKEVKHRAINYAVYCHLKNRVLNFPSDLPKGSVSEFIVNKVPMPYPLTHVVEDYVEAFRSFHHKPKGYLGAGGEQVAIELENGDVLKIQQGEPEEYFGKRPFDLPVLEKGMIPIISPVTGQARNIHYLIQPKVEMTATEEDVIKFKSELKNQGYYECYDLSKSQIGFYNEKLFLIDYSAAQGYHQKN